ncbi:MAG: PEP-CTERM sorting domain-containing protein [Phycisphaerae bacterium]
MELPEHYHVRVLNMYGGDNWVPISAGLKDSSGQLAGWNRYQAIFTESSLTVTIDLGADGSIDGTFVSAGAPSATPFIDLRFGGPSNLSSAGGGASFDNISLEVIPEPATLSLLALGGIAALRRRR